MGVQELQQEYFPKILRELKRIADALEAFSEKASAKTEVKEDKTIVNSETTGILFEDNSEDFA